MAHARALFIQCADFPFTQAKGIEFLHLVAQQIEPGMAIARRRLGRHAPVHQRQPGGVRGAYLADLRFELPEFIQQLALRVAAHQRLKFMLAVDVEQQLADPRAAPTPGRFGR